MSDPTLTLTIPKTSITVSAVMGGDSKGKISINDPKSNSTGSYNTLSKDGTFNVGGVNGKVHFDDSSNSPASVTFPLGGATWTLDFDTSGEHQGVINKIVIATPNAKYHGVSVSGKVVITPKWVNGGVVITYQEIVVLPLIGEHVIATQTSDLSSALKLGEFLDLAVTDTIGTKYNADAQAIEDAIDGQAPKQINTNVKRQISPIRAYDLENLQADRIEKTSAQGAATSPGAEFSINGDSGTIVAGASNTSLSDSSGNDTVESGVGATEVYGGAGNNNIQGQPGQVLDYVYSANSSGVSGAPEVDTITTNGATGTINYLDGSGSQQKIAGPGSGVKPVVSGSSVVWTASDGTTYTFTPGSSSPTIGTLTISQGVLGSSGGQISITDFNLAQAENTAGSGFMGIQFAPQIAVIVGTGANPLLPGGTAITASVTASGEEQSLTFFTSAAQDTAQTLTISTSGLSSGYWDTGTGLIPTSGTVTLTIPAGQDSVTVGLIDTSTSQSAQNAQISATLNSDSAASNTVSVTFAGAGQSVTPNTVIDPNPPGSLVGYTGDGNNDIIGNDTVTGTWYDLGWGNDSVIGGGGNIYESFANGPASNPSAPAPPSVASQGPTDTVIGGGGQNVMWGVNGNYIFYANNQESLATALSQLPSEAYSSSQADGITFGNGNNTVIGGAGNETITVGAGNDVIVCGPGVNTFVGGIEALAAGVGSAASISGTQISLSNLESSAWTFTAPDNYEGATILNTLPVDAQTSMDDFPGQPAAGTVTPLGTGNDTIYGGTGNSTYWLPNGNNYLDAGGGNDTIQASTGQSTIFGGKGNDIIGSGGGNNYIDAESGNDIILGQGGNLTVDGGTGNDTIYSGNVAGWATSITTNNSVINAGNGNTVVYGAGGNDTINAGKGNDTLNAGAGNEFLQGGDGNVIMQGGAGNDTLSAGDGNASINAGSGNTTIIGGDGIDTIWGGSGTNLISAGDGGTDGSPTVVNAGSGSTTINGGDGVDQIWGGSGTDVLNAGDGGDSGQATQVTAGSGDTTINGGDGIDNLLGGGGNDSIAAGDGGTATNATSITGGSGSDTMVSGLGYDNFYGGTGSNTYQINAGGGTISIYNTQSTDTLTFGQGLAIGNLASINQATYSNGTSLTLTFDDGTSVTVYGSNLTQATFGDGTVATFSQLLSGQFSVGDVTYSAVNAALPGSAQPSFGQAGTGGLSQIVAEAGSPQPETLTLYGSADLVGQGNNVNDVITANSGNDTLIAGTANNTLVGGGASDIYEVSATTGTVTTIDTSTEADALVFASGTTLSDLSVSASNDVNGDLDVTIQNSQGSEVVVNGVLNSTANGGDGSSTMLDEIAFADGTTASLSQLVAQLTSGPTAATSSANVTLAGGIQNMTLTAANISATGNDQADVLTAGAANDTLIAGSGSDTLNSAGVGHTTFEFNASSGDVTIDGAGSNDTLQFDSSVTESDLTYSQTTVNGATVTTITDALGGTITFQGGLPGDIAFADGNTATTGDLLANDYLNGSGTSEYANVNVTASGGVSSLYLTGDADVSGTANGASMILYSNIGNDTLVAGTANDTLVGGGVSDLYEIAAGNQTTTIEQSSMFDGISFSSGVTAADLSAAESTVDGVEVITLVNSLGGTVQVDVGAGAPVDTILFADGSFASLGDLLAQATTGDSAATSSVSVTLPEGTQNMQLTGSASITATGNELSNVITANSGNDTLVAGFGNDTFVGSSGSTTYEFDASDGNLAIRNSAAGDTLVLDSSIWESDITATSTVVGGQTVVTLTTDDGQAITIEGSLNQVSFSDGNTATIADLLANSYTNGTSTYSNVSATAGSGITTLALTGGANIVATANSGNDVLIANSGNDTLVAGSGDDTFFGGVGNTTYSMATGYGAATLAYAGVDDTIAFAQGVTPGDISFVESQASDSSITLTIDNSAGNSITIPDYAPGMADTLSFTDGETVSVQAVLAQSTSGFSAATSAVNVDLPEGIQNMALTGTANLLAVGNDDDDVITANSGNDTLVAGSANDTLIAGTGNDLLVGGAGNTIYEIQAGDGTTTIAQSGPGDTLSLPASIQQIQISEAADGTATITLDESNGMTVVLDDSGTLLSQITYVNGGTTTTMTLSALIAQVGAQLSTASPSQPFVVPAGLSNFTIGSSGMSIVSNNGNDTITDNSGNNSITGGSGNDLLISGGDDTLVGGSGNETLQGSYGGNVLEAGSGNDLLIGAGGPETLLAGSGNDTIEPFGSVPQGSWAPNITIVDSSASDVLLLPSVSSYYTTFEAAETNGVITAVTIYYGNGTATIDVGPNGQMLDAVQVGNETYSLSALLAASTAGATAMTSSTSTTMPAGILNLKLTGTADISGTGNNLNDYITANTGNDTLIAGSGNDTLVGSTVHGTNDTMVGGTGSTTYMVQESALTIQQSNATDTLVFPEFINSLSFVPSTLASISVNVSLDGNNQEIVTIGGTTATVTIDAGPSGQMLGNVQLYTNVNSSTETATPITYSISQVIAQATTGITAMTSASSVSALPAGIQNLTLTGAGNLSASGNSLDDVITGNAGNDTLTAGSGVDTLVAGTGNATLVGGNGNTTYTVSWHSGQSSTVTIDQSQAGDTLDLSNASIGQFTASTATVNGATVTTVQVLGSATGTSGGETITINGTAPSTIEYNGGSISLSELTSPTYVVGQTAYSTVSTNMPANIDNLVLLGTANLTATASPTASNTITSNQGNDTLVAGAGSEIFVNGGTGSNSDTYLINQGNGALTIEGAHYGDVLQFGAGITESDLSASIGSGYINIADTQGGTVSIQYSQNDPPLNQVEFADGTSTTLTQLFAQNPSNAVNLTTAGQSLTTPLTGTSVTASANNIDAGNFYDPLNELLTASAANDTLIAGSGHDTMIAASTASASVFQGFNNDTFVIDANSGMTTLSLSATTSGDTIEFGTGIASSGVTANSTYTATTGWQWTLTTNQGATVVLPYSVNGPNSVTFSDGTTDTFAQMVAAPTIVDGALTAQSSVTVTGGTGTANLTFTGIESVSGQDDLADATITSNGGNDTIEAAGNNDSLLAGMGNTTITANGTNDLFYGASGSGYDYISASGNNDTLTAGNGGMGGTASGNGDIYNGFYDTVANTQAGIDLSGSGDNVTLGSGSQQVTLGGANDVIDFYGYGYSSGGGTLYVQTIGDSEDTVVGGGGNTTYSFVNEDEAGGGGGTVYAYLENTTSSDVLDLPAGVNPTELTLTSTTVGGVAATDIVWSGGNVTVSGGLNELAFYAPNYNITGGANPPVTNVLSLSQLESMSAPTTISQSETVPTGVTVANTNAGSITITANDLNDYIAVNYGFDDTLVSGAGNDTLDGSGMESGSPYGQSSQMSEYVIAAGSGTTTILPSFGLSNLVFQGSVLESDVSATSSTVNGTTVVTLTVAGANPVVLVDPTIENIIFSDGSSVSFAALLSTMTSSVSTVMPAGITTLVLTGTSNISGTGNSSADTIQANSGNDTLIAGSGLATLIGGSGTDTFVVNNTSDVIQQGTANPADVVQTTATYTLPANLSILTDTGSSAITLTGNSLADTITAGSGNDTLKAGSGNDTLISGTGVVSMVGGAGNDTFVVNNTGDKISVSSAKAGNIVQSSVNYTLPTNLLNLVGEGTASISLTGNASADTITANSGNDTLTAGSGLATLVGGAGNDTFVINNSSDAITVSTAKAGNVVQSSVNYVLPANLLTLTGTGSTSVNLTGNTLADKITANSGNDTLTSGTGIDTLVGGTGNDTFIVNNSSDAITVSSAKTGNVVQSTVNYVLPTNLLNLTGTGTASISLTGNASADTITANSGNDTLTAGSGLATLIGGAGNDTFVVNSASDVITEAANTGNNTESTNVAVTLATNVQNLIATGTAAIKLTGSNGSNITITGNSGNDTLAAGTGNDTLTAGTGSAKTTFTGSSGNDTFVINNTADVITASSGTNVNTIESSVSFTASTNVQDLFGTGSSAITLTGNSGNDLLIGNSGNDTLTAGSGATVIEAGSGTDVMKDTASANVMMGGAGNDSMTGGTGVSFLVGGAGNDAITLGAGTAVVAFNTGAGKATIAVGTGTSNVLSLGGGIAYANLAFSKSGNNLILSTGGNNTITFTNWYSASSDQDFVTLQVIEQAAATYSPTSSNTLYSSEVETFNFTSLVAAFNTALAANPSLTSWSLSNALLTDHLSSSNTAALGGDLAYYDGLNGNLTGLNLATANTTLQSSSFGKTAQTIDTWSGISNGTNKIH